MTSPLRILAWIFGAVALLILVAVIAVPLLFDPNDYREEIGALVKAKTGRALTIEGDLTVSVFPWLGVEAGETQLANARGFGPAPFASVDGATIALRILPLLRGKVELRTIQLTGLRLHLARDRQGRTNWEDLSQTAPQRPPQKPSEGKPVLAVLQLAGVKVREGEVTWQDQSQGREAQIENLTLVTGPLRGDVPLKLSLDADFAVSAPETSGHVAMEGELLHNLAEQHYRAKDLSIKLDARGNGLPGRTLALSIESDAVADLKAQTAKVEQLRLEAYGLLLQASGSATRLLDKPDARGEMALEVKEQDRLANTLSHLLPDLPFEPQSLAGGKITTRFDLSLSRGMANLPNIRAALLGTNIDLGLVARKLLDKPAVKGAMRIAIRDGALLSSPISASLPEDFEGKALNGGVVESRFGIDLATGRLALTNTRLNALGLRLAAEAKGRALFTSPTLRGKLALEEFVPRDLFAKIGVKPPPMVDPAALSKASLTTGFDVGADHLALSNLVLRFDQSRLLGQAAVERFEPLKLRYSLNLDELDVDRYLPPPSKKKPVPAATGAALAPLQLPIGRLRALDIDGTLRVGKLKAANIRSEKVRATLRARDGRFRLHPVGAKLYEGSYAGNLGMDVRRKTPQLSLDEKLQGVQVGPLLTDFMGKEYVSGKAQLSAKLTAQGTDFIQIRKSMNGTGRFRFEDGAVHGINLGQLLRESYAKFKGQPAPKEETRKTDFAELQGTFTVKNGLVSTNNLSAKSPLLRVTGRGTAHLVSEKVDYRLDTTVVSSFEGQGAKDLGQLKEVTVPIQIAGTFTEPKFNIDLGAALQERANEALEAEKRKLQRRLEEERKKQEERLEEQLQQRLKGLLK